MRLPVTGYAPNELRKANNKSLLILFTSFIYGFQNLWRRFSHLQKSHYILIAISFVIRSRIPTDILVTNLHRQVLFYKLSEKKELNLHPIWLCFYDCAVICWNINISSSVFRALIPEVPTLCGSATVTPFSVLCLIYHRANRYTKESNQSYDITKHVKSSRKLYFCGWQRARTSYTNLNYLQF